MKVYASISGGKDSLAAIITHMERGGQCDGAIYCRIMFDDETSAEVPEHEEWLHSKCFPLLERVWGDRIFEKCGIRRDEGGDGGKTLEIRGKRRLSARDGGANYQQS